MFRKLAGNIPEGANELFSQHPSVLITALEMAWNYRQKEKKELGHPYNRSIINGLPSFWLDDLIGYDRIISPPDNLESSEGRETSTYTTLWDHLIYAYMIENTRIYEIFRRVLSEFLHGEKLGIPEPDAMIWLRNTEELFYRDPLPFSITAINSYIRPDMRASRRNAYQRMFGMDLNHGTEDNQPYPYIRADTYNKEFVTIFEELLREAWVAIANVGNQSGANPTDKGKIENLVVNLQDMLMSRRQYGNLSREEFVFVSMMSWFHLAVEYNSPIVETLKASASSPEQRLFKIAQRVGLPAHGLSKSYFDIADPISRLLIQVEADGKYMVPGLLVKGSLQDTVNTIITHWSLITGRDMKARKVSTT